ncbi:hypothetical protein AAA799D07_00440 [Marine Group I thaumarchaeote SCGC AAA799-D07]|nr:hypothetical protein AAA799D07_00440 [Marine Group I thaumarchaeote SCGC AAA799-D07]
MDKKIQEVLEEKVRESIHAKDEINLLVNNYNYKKTDLPQNVFACGIMIGRLYNSFYYQSRRILKRDPTKQEFAEFIKFLQKHENVLSQISLL